MSDQEKKGGGGSGASVVLVEKTASSRHKPYRPTELEESAPDLHKRSRAPAVPSVAEELKDTTVNETIGPVERMENERSVSSDKQTHVSKKISSSKRRASSPEDIAMVLMDVKKDTIATAPQPIPAHIDTVVSEESNLKPTDKRNEEKGADDDSITEEIAELRTSDATKKHSEWSDDEEAGGLPRSESRASRVSRAVRQLFCCGISYNAPSEEDMSPRKDQPTHSSAIKKKEISWKESNNLNRVHLKDENVKSLASLLERKASVGPCNKPNKLYGGPSGISVCVPKKSVRNMKEESVAIPSVINFNVSKKLEMKCFFHEENPSQRTISTLVVPQKPKPALKKLEKQLKIDQPHPKFFEGLRGKLDNMTSKIRTKLNM